MRTTPASSRTWCSRRSKAALKNVVIDLARVQFIDSSGLGALLSGYKNASLRSSGFALAGLQPRVRSMFELTRLHRVFDIYPSLQLALSA